MGTSTTTSLYTFLVYLLLLLLLVLSVSGEDGVRITRNDLTALRSIKKELIDYKGALKSWNATGYGACSGSWTGIKCVNGQVIAIQLPSKVLGGKLSQSIGNLQALRKISFHDNLITGSIPNSIGLLPNLRGLYLFNNRLSGSIPFTFANLLMIQNIDLSNNFISGVIPPNLANSTRLFRLNVSYNLLNGTIPVTLTRSISLTILDLQNNTLSGSIPDSWGSENGLNETHMMQVLKLDNNHLSGSIPISLSKLGMLQEVSISRNLITGTIPEQIGIANLTSFDVSHNNLSGTVPASLNKKFSPSSFVGNLQLCGYSDSSQCPAPAPINVSPSPPQKRHRKFSTKDIILIAAGILLAVLLVLCCVLLICLMRKRASLKGQNGKSVANLSKTEKAAVEVEAGGEMGGKLVHFDGPFVFTADDLLCATAEIMGKSTYGTAYKATFEDSNQVAVKRLREKTTKIQKEFEAEAAALGKIRHPNLLALRAYYLGPKGEKLLVFDFMPRGSLASFLHARGPETIIEWPTRMKIAIGITRGLNYLHTEENIIHGNLTSSNVLLDEQTNAHIADYGISRLMTDAANTNVIATAGTQGYRAPEFSKLKSVNTKTDVYSLGVIILELLTGKSPSESLDGGVDLPQWVASIVKEEWTNEVFDLELMRDAPAVSDELLNTLKLALHCVDPTPAARPEVVQVLQQLEEIKPEVAASLGDEEQSKGSPPPMTKE
ncbi:hypothetical protein ACFE04_002738 [Oxalis oulophora]